MEPGISQLRQAERWRRYRRLLDLEVERQGRRLEEALGDLEYWVEVRSQAFPTGLGAARQVGIRVLGLVTDWVRTL